MHKKFYRIFLSLFLLALAQTTALSQQAEWIRTMSDNGEFSVEIPAEYYFFTDKEGFTVADSSKTYQLTEMNMLNAYLDKTLISVETYRGGKSALNALRLLNKESGEISEIREDGYIVKKVVVKTDQSYSVIKYLQSKDYVYILTAASRTGETPAMKRFFDSLVFKPDAKIPAGTQKVTAFSELSVTPIEMASASPVKPLIDIKPALSIGDLKGEITPILLITKPSPAYTDAARKKKLSGTASMRVTFTKKGWVARVFVLESPGDELTRQAFFAAIRIKFLPTERNGEPIAIIKPVQYIFSIY